MVAACDIAPGVTITNLPHWPLVFFFQVSVDTILGFVLFVLDPCGFIIIAPDFELGRVCVRVLTNKALSFKFWVRNLCISSLHSGIGMGTSELSNCAAGAGIKMRAPFFRSTE